MQGWGGGSAAVDASEVDVVVDSPCPGNPEPLIHTIIIS